MTTAMSATTSAPLTTRVAVLGTGLLGSGFVEGLLSRGGTAVTVWNRTRAKAEHLTSLGARVAESPAEAVRGAERVHLVLLDDDSVDEAITALRPGLGNGVVIVDHTTNLPARTAARAAALDAQGIEYLHVPVMMGPPAARAARGIMIVAGPKPRFEKVKDALTPMTGEVWYVGERADLAAAYKLFANALMIAVAGGVSDVLHMADALQVSREDTLAIYRKVAFDSFLTLRGPKVLVDDYTPLFALDTARKDVGLMVTSAGDEPVPVLRAIASRMDDLIAEGNGALDYSVIARAGEVRGA